MEIVAVPSLTSSLTPALASTLLLESACGIASAFAVAPIVSILDKAIICNASGLEPLIPCCINGTKELFFKPTYFFRQPSFLLIWGVFSGTYLVGNCSESLCAYYERSSFFPKLVASSMTNVTLSVLKDKAFTRMFGVGTPKPLPAMSYLLFGIRDGATIFSSFIATGPISAYLQRHSSMSPVVCDTVTQLLSPILMQIFSTPIHLLGLDLYNHQGKEVAFKDRIEFIRKEYFNTLAARMTRIFPAFGIGGVLNKKLRTWSKMTFL